MYRYVDPTQFDSKDAHYDASSEKSDPKWLVMTIFEKKKKQYADLCKCRKMVDVAFERKFKKPILRETLKADESLVSTMVCVKE
jgi:predicted RNA-binding protein with PUA-like domain